MLFLGGAERLKPIIAGVPEFSELSARARGCGAPLTDKAITPDGTVNPHYAFRGCSADDRDAVAFGCGALSRYALRLRRPSPRAALESADREAAFFRREVPPDYEGFSLSM